MNERPLDDGRLEAYLDHQLSPEEAQQFEQRLRDDPALREQLSLARDLDASLRRTFPDRAASAESIERVRDAATSATKVQRPASTQRRKLVVAVLAATVGATMAGWQLLNSGLLKKDRPYRLVTFEQIYDNAVNSGFKPTWLCEDDREFIETFEKRQGQGLRLAKLPSNMKMAGLAYIGGVTAQTTTLMMWVDGQPVMVFVETKDRDRPKEPPSWSSGLNLFRREKLGLVFYELSPLDESRIIDLLEPADSADLPPVEAAEG